MAAAAETNEVKLDRLFRKLHGAIEEDDAALAAATANDILKISPKDKDALEAKATALIKQSDFKGALDCLDTSTSKNAFRKAYCHYKLFEHGLAAEALKLVKERDDGVRHLEAQLKYRTGDFRGAAKIYDSEMKNLRDDEFTTNKLAIYVGAGMVAEAREVVKSSQHQTYEILYNTACVLISGGQLKEAQKLLDEAKVVCTETFEADGATPEEIKDESAVLEAQYAYVYQLLGENDAAMTLYQNVLNDKPSDMSVIAVASNNIITLRKRDEKLFDSLKKSERAVKIPDAKLSPEQRRAVHLNRCLLLLHGKKYPECRQLAEELAREYPDSEVPVLILASLQQREKNMSQCVALLNDYIKAHPDTSVQTQLTLAFFLLLEGKTTDATESLRSISLIQHRLGTVATLVALYERANAVDKANQVLDDAVKYWESKSKSDPRAPQFVGVLLEKSADFKLRHNRHTDALAVLDRLVADRKGNAQYISTAVIVASKIDPNAAAKYASQLPKFAGTESLDVKALEAGSAPRAPTATKKEKAEDTARDDENEAVDAAEQVVKKKKKTNKKKKRLPKNFDPNNPGPLPDPERWLPRWERSKGKKGRKRRKDAVNKGAQGAAPTDASPPPSPTRKPSEPAPAMSPTAGKKLPPPAASKGGKKKKGGKRW